MKRSFFKAKIGKKEQYLKDDAAFMRFLFEWAQEQTVLTIAGKEVELETLSNTLIDVQEYDSKLSNLSIGGGGLP